MVPIGDRRMLLWELDEMAGFDSAWVAVGGTRLRASGLQAGLNPTPYWVRYKLETIDDFVTSRMRVAAVLDGDRRSLDLRRSADGQWTVDGHPRPDLDGALDVDLAACPLTNTMPIRRHRLHAVPGRQGLLMAFIEVPNLRVVPNPQQYTHLRHEEGGGAKVRYRSGTFSSDLLVDADGYVIDYPQLGRRVEPFAVDRRLRAAGPGSVRPE